MRRLLLASCVALLLAACATTPVSHEPLTAPAQEALLRNLRGFSFDGRAGVRAGEQGSTGIPLSWHQRAAESQLRLSGSFGVGGMKLVYSRDSLRLTTSRGEKLADADAEQALSSQLGFIPPFEALRYWVLGLVAPGEPPTEQATDASGRIAEMTQQGWRIHYDRWASTATPAGEVQLPQHLTAARADLRLSLVVDRWKLQAAD